MTDTVRTGTASYAIALSSSVGTDGGGSAIPAGDIQYIGAQKVRPKWTLLTKPKHQPGRMSFAVKDAKKYYSIEISEAFITNKVESTAIEEYNKFMEYIESWTDLGHDPIYLLVSTQSLNLSGHKLMKFKDHLGVSHEYLKGYPIDISCELSASVNYVSCTINFEECWL